METRQIECVECTAELRKAEHALYCDASQLKEWLDKNRIVEAEIIKRRIADAMHDLARVFGKNPEDLYLPEMAEWARKAEKDRED